jgi:hypothetical protein
VNIAYSREERVFILEHCFASKSFAAVREALSNMFPEKEVPNKAKVHRPVTNFGTQGVFVCYKCSSSNKTAKITAIPIFSIAIGFIVLCVKGFMCGS